MTLDEAIKHCEEKEREQALNGCFACAEEHKQLAEWLKDYKQLLEERPQGNWIKSGKTTFFCSECGREINTKPFTRPNNFPFCHCGAKMKGGKEE